MKRVCRTTPDRTRRPWVLLLLVIGLTWSIFLGLSTTILAEQERVGLALGLLVASGIVLFAINGVAGGPRTSRATYRFLAIWGISLPLLVTYLAPITHKGVSALTANIIVVILALAWANWTLAIPDRNRVTGMVSLAGAVCIGIGAAVAIWSWGSATLSEWPMMPYVGYMLHQRLLYLGLLLVGIGAVLWVFALPWDPSASLSRALRGLTRELLDRLKGLVVLGIVLGILIAVVGLYRVFRVPFPKEFTRVDATQGRGEALMAKVEKLDLSELLGGPVEWENPRFVDGSVLRHYVARSWSFRLRAPDDPGFRENGWLKYAARVDFFRGSVTKDGPNIMVTGLNGSAIGRAPGAYWYSRGNKTEIGEGFVVTVSLSYGEVYANLGGAGFDLEDQYAIFDEQQELVAILAPVRRMWRA